MGAKKGEGALRGKNDTRIPQKKDSTMWGENGHRVQGDLAQREQKSRQGSKRVSGGNQRGIKLGQKGKSGQKPSRYRTGEKEESRSTVPYPYGTESKRGGKHKEGR